MSATLLVEEPISDGSSESSPWPTTTSYVVSPVTAMWVTLGTIFRQSQLINDGVNYLSGGVTFGVDDDPGHLGVEKLKPCSCLLQQRRVYAIDAGVCCNGGRNRLKHRWFGLLRKDRRQDQKPVRSPYFGNWQGPSILIRTFLAW